jgi:hypothetical protein
MAIIKNDDIHVEEKTALGVLQEWFLDGRLVTEDVLIRHIMEDISKQRLVSEVFLTKFLQEVPLGESSVKKLVGEFQHQIARLVWSDQLRYDNYTRALGIVMGRMSRVENALSIISGV